METLDKLQCGCHHGCTTICITSPYSSNSRANKWIPYVISINLLKSLWNFYELLKSYHVFLFKTCIQKSGFNHGSSEHRQNFILKFKKIGQLIKELNKEHTSKNMNLQNHSIHFENSKVRNKYINIMTSMYRNRPFTNLTFLLYSHSHLQHP